jgi:hypothetical protein
MARTALTVQALGPNAATAQPAGVVGQADGHYVDTNVRTTINDDVKLEHLLLHVTVATATTTVTVRAGDYPPALDADRGDLVASLPVGSHFIGPFTSSRFLKTSGQVHIDYGTPANVTVRALRVPRNV